MSLTDSTSTSPTPATGAITADGAPAPRAGRKPDWLLKRVPLGAPAGRTTEILHELKLVTVCEEARCPNRHECYSNHGTATFMILGDTCTRNCAFCAVSHGKPAEPPDPTEPWRLAEAARQMGLRHIVITSVDRDDLPDGGAQHFNDVLTKCRERLGPAVTLEVLTPDFRGRLESVDTVCDAVPDVFNHNIETVPRLYKRARAGAKFERSLAILKRGAEVGKARVQRPEGAFDIVTKSGIMLGLGEERAELLEVFAALREHDVTAITIGQYLAPSKEHLPVERYVPPHEFEELGQICREQFGFTRVASGPFVRSSYHAEEFHHQRP